MHPHPSTEASGTGKQESEHLDAFFRAPSIIPGIYLPRTAAMLLLLTLLILIVALLSFSIGYIQLGPWQVLQTVIGQGTDRDELILFQFRAPRIVLAVMIGMMLAAAGAILQAVSQNGLADSGLLGINSGAGLGVTSMLLYWRSAQAEVPFLLPLSALAGGLAAAAVIYSLAYKRGQVTPSRLLLVGVAVGFGISAVSLIVSLRLEPEVYQSAVLWQVGSISGTSWRSVLVLLPWLLVLLPLAMLQARMLDILNLGDQVATGLGAAVEWQRRMLIVVSVALAAAAVAIGGGIGFVGLVCPHLARRLVGPGHRAMLPTAVLLGGLLLVIADSLGRNLFAPLQIPVGIVVAVIGAPYFLYLLYRTTG